MALRLPAALHLPPRTPAVRRAIQCSTSNFSTLNPATTTSKDFQNQNRHYLLNSPIISTKRPILIGQFTVRSALPWSSPIVAPNDHWGTLTALFASAAFGYWSENTKIGSALSGPLVATLVGLAASNLGIIASEAKTYSVVLEYLLPLAVPLLLFRADIRHVIKSTGRLLLAFLIGSGTKMCGSSPGAETRTYGEIKTRVVQPGGCFSCNYCWNCSSICSSVNAITWSGCMEDSCSSSWVDISVEMA